MSTQALSATSPVETRTPERLLRTVLRFDGASSAAMGAVLLAGSGPFSSILGLPTTLSVPIGVALLFGGAALGLLAGYPTIPHGPAWAVIGLNVLGFAGCLLLAFTDLVPLTGLGVAFVLVGAAVVAAFAELELVGLRNLARAGR